MSRSNPQENMLPNPAKHIIEWDGGNGRLKGFNKAEKKTTVTPAPFKCIPLDELGTVRGYDDQLQCGIYSNEIRDSRTDILVVKRHKQETVAEGIWRVIKPKVNLAGGSFHAVIYIAFKPAGTDLQIGVLRLRGAALNAWIEFSKQHKADLYKKALVIDGVVEGQKGAVKFKVPKFALAPISETAEIDAIALDKELQAYFGSYFAKTKREQIDSSMDALPDHVRDEDMPTSPPPSLPTGDDVDADDIPF